MAKGQQPKISNKKTDDEGNGDSPAAEPVPNTFESLHPPLSSGVLDFVKSQNFTRMTPVQAATIPLFLSSKDVAVKAVTGSGKTLAFLIPIVETLLKKKFKKHQIGALVLSPTRELAHQTHSVATMLCAACGLKAPQLLHGGSSSSSSSSSTRPVTADLQAFQQNGTDLMIGTPGRIEDVLQRYAVIDTSELDYLILDEADVLLNMGFAVTVQNILARLPKMRRTGLFSATTSTTTNSSLKEWIKRAGLRNPVWIDVSVSAKSSAPGAGTAGDVTTSKQIATPASLTNYYLVCALDEKLSRLAAFLQDHREEKIIVFFLTCACVEFYGNVLQKLLTDNYIEPLHGKMVQKRREKAMERFRDCGTETNADALSSKTQGGALLCTDVAARGLDVDNVQWVVQYDAPQDPAFFVHRVGRSARAGKLGNSLLFLSRKEEAYVDLLGMKKVPLLPLPKSERCCPPEVDENNKDEKIKSGGNDSNDRSQIRYICSAANKEKGIDDILPKVRELVMRDRDVLEKGTKAFTSYIRAYKEHHCNFIFRFASLDLGLLATSFCLLRLPKMPELRDVLDRNKGHLPHFTPAGSEVDIFSIPYKDKVREVARQKRLQQEVEAGGKNAKLIKAEQRKAEKEKKLKERRQLAVDKGRNPDKKRGKNARITDEWDDLAKEERLYKKMRRGKISKDEYEKQLHG